MMNTPNVQTVQLGCPIFRQGDDLQLTRDTMMNNTHPTKKVTLVPALRVDLDVKLAGLIPLLWKAGLRTTQCCQEAEPGLASISFFDIDDALGFLNLAGREYPLKVETWDEGFADDPHIVGSLSVLFPTNDIPDVVKMVSTRM